jgi:hypothetical protein
LPCAGGGTPIWIDPLGISDKDGARFSADAELAIPDAGNINPEKGAISFWLQPDWNGTGPGNASLVQLREQHTWENRMQIFKNGDGLRFIFTPNTGIESDVTDNISNRIS